MRVFLTGASGFLGSWLAEELLLRGHEVAALTRSDAAAVRLRREMPRIDIIPGDLFEPSSYRKNLEGFRPEALIHCGWRGVEGAARNDLAQLDNISAATRLARTAIDLGARVIVGVGSQAEYGPRAYPISEDEPTRPKTLYGVAKVAVGDAFLQIGDANDIRVVWGRVFSLYGPGDDGQWLIPSLLRAFAAGQPMALTKCAQRWEFTHVRDAARGFISLLETPTAHGVFNVAAGRAVCLRNVVMTLRELMAADVSPVFGALAYRPDQVMHLEAKIDRIREATGWSPQTSLADGLAETVIWFRKRHAA